MSVFQKKGGNEIDYKRATIISEGCVIEGSISGEGSIRIDGEVHGNIEMKQHVTVGSKGVVTGNIGTSELTLFGKLKGNVSASVLEIKAGGNICGDISTAQMAIEMGAIHNGNVSMSSHKGQAEVKKSLVTAE